MPEPEGQGGGSIVPEGVKSKLGPFPVWVWVVAGAGVIGIALYVRGRRAPSGTQTVGSLATTDPSTGITSPNPLTADQLLQALNDLSTQLANYQAAQATAASAAATATGRKPGLPYVGPNQNGGSPPAGNRAVNQSPGAPPAGDRGVNQSPPVGGAPLILRVVGSHWKRYASIVNSGPEDLFAISSTHTMGGTSTAHLTEGPSRLVHNSPSTLRRAPRR